MEFRASFVSIGEYPFTASFSIQLEDTLFLPAYLQLFPTPPYRPDVLQAIHEVGPHVKVAPLAERSSLEDIEACKVRLTHLFPVFYSQETGVLLDTCLLPHTPREMETAKCPFDTYVPQAREGILFLR